MPAAAPDRVAEVRAFNRFYTAKVGVLRAGFLGTRWSLAEGRVLYELAQAPAVDAADLRLALSIDRGQLSRILARLEDRGVVTRERSATDARRQTVRLTPAGRAAFEDLNARSAQEIGALLSAHEAGDQERLVGAMRAIREVLASDAPTQRKPRILLREPAPGDIGWMLERHAVLYAREYGWGAAMEALIARVLADFAAQHDPARERVWIAELDGRRAGSVMVVEREPGVAQLRLLLVEPEARGAGVGGALLDAALGFARAAGYDEITLWTQNVLTAARRLYERAGFREIAAEPHRMFGDELVAQTLSHRLR
jgi:DNA-binding MarR family transcriptional regulator/predicted GNAT family acetyltransferase